LLEQPRRLLQRLEDGDEARLQCRRAKDAVAIACLQGVAFSVGVFKRHNGKRTRSSIPDLRFELLMGDALGYEQIDGYILGHHERWIDTKDGFCLRDDPVRYKG